MQLIYRCCARDDRSGCSSINLLFNNWFGDEFKGLCNLTVNFQGFALILVVSAIESVIMSKCCWVGLLLCACSVFSALRWNSVTSLVWLLFQSSYLIADFSSGVCGPSQCWMQRIVQARTCLVVSSGLGMPSNSPRSACRTSPLRRLPAFIWFQWS